jgi:hypothetical protein
VAESETREWIKVGVDHPPNELRLFGPCVPIEISTLDGASAAQAVAQIDTGASTSCISPELYEQLRFLPCWRPESQALRPAPR